jgi:hypothetical protein
MKWHRLLALALFLPQLLSATANVSGKLAAPDTTGVPSGSVARLDLRNCGGNYPVVSGASITTRQEYTLAADGTWSGVLYRNDEISCNGSFTTFWTLTYFVRNVQAGPSRDYLCSQASCNFDSMTPITVYPPPTPPAQPLTGAESVVCSFPVAASTWSCTENMGTQQLVAEFFDLTFTQIFPDSAQATDVNTFVGTFLQPQAGYMRVVNVGNWTPSTLFPNYLIGNPTSSQSVLGDYPFTLGGSLSAKRYQNIRNVNNFTGGDLGAQFNAACADASAGDILYYNGHGIAATITTQVTCTKQIAWLIDNPNITSSITAFWIQVNNSLFVQRGGTIAASASLPVGSPLILVQSNPSGGNIQDVTLAGLNLINNRNSRTGIVKIYQSIGVRVRDMVIDGLNFFTSELELAGGFGDTVESIHGNRVGGAPCVLIQGWSTVSYNTSNDSLKDINCIGGPMVLANYNQGNGPNLLDSTNIIGGTNTYGGTTLAKLSVSTFANSPTAGATSLNVQAGQGTNFRAGDLCIVGDAGNAEENVVSSIATDTLNLMFPTFVNHSSGQRVICGTWGIIVLSNTHAIKIDSVHLQDCGDCIDLQEAKAVAIMSSTTGATSSLVGDGVRCDPCYGVSILDLRGGNNLNMVHVTNKQGSWLAQSRHVHVYEAYNAGATNVLTSDVSDTSTALADIWASGDGLQNSQLLTGLVPQFILADTTPAQATPNKTLRSANGQLQMCNSAGSGCPFTVSDTGVLGIPSLVLNGGTALTGQTGSGASIVTNSGPTIASPVLSTGVGPDGSGFKHKRVTGCTTGATSGNTCTTTVTWGTAFADANYTAVCTLLGPATLGHLAAIATDVIAAASVKVETVTDTNAAIAGTISCIAVHD